MASWLVIRKEESFDGDILGGFKVDVAVKVVVAETIEEAWEKAEAEKAAAEKAAEKAEASGPWIDYDIVALEGLDDYYYFE